MVEPPIDENPTQIFQQFDVDNTGYIEFDESRFENPMYSVLSCLVRLALSCLVLFSVRPCTLI
jgi:hypothetical protein